VIREALTNAAKKASTSKAWSATKPEPVRLPYSSSTNPEFYDWTPARTANPRRIDSTHQFGPVARLKQKYIDALNAERNGVFQRNMGWSVAA